MKSTPNERILRMELLDDALAIYRRFGIDDRVGGLVNCSRYTYGVTGINIDSIGNLYFQGLYSCNCASSCPRCSYKRRMEQRNEIAAGIWSARHKGLCVYLVTFTFRHSMADEVSVLFEGFQAAKEHMYRNGSYRRFMAGLGYKGRITDFEVRMLGEAGYHPHDHDLYFFDRPMDEGFIRDCIASYWVDALECVGLSARNDISVDVTGYQGVGDYITKISSELTLGDFKHDWKGGSVSPFQLLKLYHDDPSDYLGAWWADYVLAVRRKRILGWSRGLRDLLGVRDMSKVDDFKGNDDSVLILDDYNDYKKLKPWQWQTIKECLQVGKMDEVSKVFKSVHILYYVNEKGLRRLEEQL